MFLFWAFLTLAHTTTNTSNYFFSALIGILPLVGGFLAVYNSDIKNGLPGFINKGVFFLGLGLFFWGCGEMIWAYYNFFLHVSAPYPSLADLGFAPSVFFYCIGIIYLARAAGADLGLQRRFARLFIVVVPVIMFIVSYYLLVVIARQGVLHTAGDSLLKSILDLAYPLGDFASLTVAMVISGLSFKSLMAEYKVAIISLLLGLGVMFAADSIFSYTTSRATYFNGDFGDLLFTLALFFLTFGVLGFASKNKEQ